MFRKPMTRPVPLGELPTLQLKRAEAIRAAGTHWLLHPANQVQRKSPSPRWVALGLMAVILLGGVGNDCDGRCPAPRVEPQLSGAP